MTYTELFFVRLFDFFPKMKSVELLGTVQKNCSGLKKKVETLVYCNLLSNRIPHFFCNLVCQSFLQNRNYET